MTGYAGQHVWIIGAGDGIGRALAAELAKRGATLALSGRDTGRLETLNAELGGGHRVVPADVTDETSLRNAVAGLAQGWPRLDRLIFMAGQYKPMTLDALDTEAARQIIATNLGGAVNAVAVSLPLLLRQGGGQLALCGSVAGYRGLPRAQPYAATKAGIVSLAESLRAETVRRGVDVRLISPGFVRTRMTEQNSFKMPALLEPAEAARRIADGLAGKAFEIHFPRRLSWPIKLLMLLPRCLYFHLVRL